jgi:hypothetical protein
MDQLSQSQKDERINSLLQNITKCWTNIHRKDEVRELDELGWRPDKSEAAAAYWAYKHEWNKCVEIGEAAIDQLEYYLAFNTRSDAADAMIEIGGSHVVNSFLENIQSNRPYDVRMICIESLIRMGQSAIEPLIIAMKSKDEHISEIARARLKDLKTKGINIDYKDLFKLYKDSGVCDVCNKSIGPDEAYLVPKDEFYSSMKYKDWLMQSALGGMIQKLGGVDAYIETLRTIDSNPSAVCFSCIHLF